MHLSDTIQGIKKESVFWIIARMHVLTVQHASFRRPVNPAGALRLHVVRGFRWYLSGALIHHQQQSCLPSMSLHLARYSTAHNQYGQKFSNGCRLHHKSWRCVFSMSWLHMPAITGLFVVHMKSSTARAAHQPRRCLAVKHTRTP